MANLDEINRRLSGDPQYRAALNGEVNFGQFPTGSDGKVLPGFRVENARAYAASQGMNNGYAVNSNGEFYDQNATHWYDPQFIGPIAVGALGGLGALGAFGGGASAAPAAAGSGLGSGAAAAAGNPASYIMGDVLGAEAAASSAGLVPSFVAPTAGVLPAGGAGLSAGAGAASAAGGVGSFLSQNKNWLGPVLGAGAGILGRTLTPQKNTQVPIPPELQQLLTEATRRQMNQGPLSDAVTQQALAGLPNYARK